MSDQNNNHFVELYGRVQKTANTRFNAHRRLIHHNNASLWTITCFSMGLIFIPLIETFGLESRFSDEYSSFIQVILAITILVISIILNMTNFSVRADRIHNCGMVLNSFARIVHRHVNDNSTPDVYDQLVKKYDEILQKHENHANIDYLFTKLRMTNYYTNPRGFSLYVRGLYLLQFTPYIILLGMEVVWIYTLVTPVTIPLAAC